MENILDEVLTDELTAEPTEPEEMTTGEPQTGQDETVSEPIAVTITGIDMIDAQSGEPIAVSVVETPRPFLTTPFEEYNVVEGYCLLFTLLIFIAILYHFVRRFI